MWFKCRFWFMVWGEVWDCAFLISSWVTWMVMILGHSEQQELRWHSLPLLCCSLWHTNQCTHISVPSTLPRSLHSPGSPGRYTSAHCYDPCVLLKAKGETLHPGATASYSVLRRGCGTLALDPSGKQEELSSETTRLSCRRAFLLKQPDCLMVQGEEARNPVQKLV